MRYNTEPSTFQRQRDERLSQQACRIKPSRSCRQRQCESPVLEPAVWDARKNPGDSNRVRGVRRRGEHIAARLEFVIRGGVTETRVVQATMHVGDLPPAGQGSFWRRTGVLALLFLARTGVLLGCSGGDSTSQRLLMESTRACQHALTLELSQYCRRSCRSFGNRLGNSHIKEPRGWPFDSSAIGFPASRIMACSFGFGSPACGTPIQYWRVSAPGRDLHFRARSPHTGRRVLAGTNSHKHVFGGRGRVLFWEVRFAEPLTTPSQIANVIKHSAHLCLLQRCCGYMPPAYQLENGWIC